MSPLTGITNTIGIPDTPVRKMIHAAAAKISTPVTLVALVVDGDGLAGIIIGDIVDAWQEATSLSEKRHIYWCSHSFKQILSCPSPRYDELWTAAKAMYKLESVTSKGGEIIVYAPHLEEVSQVHGRYIYEAGYHTLSYFLENWLQYEQIPLGVLAHLTHLRGPGLMENGIEIPDIRVTLASRISKEDCSRLNLGYLDPGYIDPSDFMNREKEGVLYVPNAGEILYRLKTPSSL